jgi:flagellar biosynthesis anti-sigma factor FlgM
MRIPGSNGPERGGQVDRARSSSSRKASDSGASGASGRGQVTASVSAKARTLAAEHGIDIDKVERLREAIQSGSFQMDFQRIAERIVQDGA